MAVGEIIGKADCFGFKIRVSEPQLKRGEYLIVEHDSEGLVLCVVANISQEKAKESKQLETIADVKVIGYRDSNGIRRIPKNAFKPGAIVWRADSKFIKRILSLSKPSKGIYLGLLEGYPDLKVELDAEKIVTKHLAVLAQSGSGKSYAVAVLLEELLGSLGKQMAVVVIDPHGEYGSLREANEEDRDRDSMEKFGVAPHAFTNVIEYAVGFGENRLYLNGLNLKSQEIASLLPSKLSGMQVGVLYEAIKALKQRSANSSYSLEEVASEVEAQEGSAKWAIVSALQELIDSEVFGPPTALNELVREGKATIVNLKGAPLEIQQAIVSRLLSELFQARKFGRVPPFFLVVEEAHNFAPERAFGEVASSRILRTIASEGRKFGLGLCAVTQRPARIDKNVLSQCNTQIILKMTNPNDIKAVAASIERFDEVLDNEIRSLPIGTAIVSGEGVDGNLFVEVRPRKSKHGGKADYSSGLREPLAKQAVRFVRAKQLVQQSFVEGLGFKVQTQLMHPFWVGETRNGSILLDAKFGKIYLPRRAGVGAIASKLFQLSEFKHSSDLSSLDSVEAAVLNEVLKRRELFDHDLSTANSLAKFDRNTVSSALDALAQSGWIACNKLGQMNSYSFEQNKLKYSEEAPLNAPPEGMALDERAAKELFDVLPAVESIALVVLPVFLVSDGAGQVRVYSGA